MVCLGFEPGADETMELWRPPLRELVRYVAQNYASNLQHVGKKVLSQCELLLYF